MFDFLFGWRTASECKKLMKTVMYRLKCLKHNRTCIVTHLRDDVARLVKLGEYQTAFDKVEQIYKDECNVVLYEILVKFCEFITKEMSYIRRNKDCPDDIKEAISSLIFASARTENLPELQSLRKLFTERYGKSFETSALEGRHVNIRIREKLSISNVPDEIKYKLFADITTNVVQSSETGVYPYENIQEFRSPFHDILNGTDQRGFMFILSDISKSHNFYDITLHCPKESGKRSNDQNHVSVGMSAFPQTSRAMMPCERHKMKCVEESGGVKKLYSHVHPKLPEYDDIVAMCTALKEEYKQNHKSGPARPEERRPHKVSRKIGSEI